MDLRYKFSIIKRKTIATLEKVKKDFNYNQSPKKF